MKDITYTYPKRTIPAVSDLSLTVESGEFLAVMGASGSGKSTFCYLLLGLLAPASGIISVGGRQKEAKKLFPRVGMVFQYPEQQLFADTVFEEIAFAPRNSGVAESEINAIVENSLNEVGLPPEKFASRNPFRLSGGEKRRVAIASILSMQPDILIFDEPTAGLDKAGKDFIIDLARVKHAAGTTIIWVTHRMEEAAELAESILIFAKDKSPLSGTPRRIFTDGELLSAYGLQQPLSAELIGRLKRAGKPLVGLAITADEACEEITNWKNKISRENKIITPQEDEL